MKSKIYIENLGKVVRLVLVDNQDEVACNLFANLNWIVSQNERHGRRENANSFVCDKKAFLKAIKAFRAVSLSPRRGEHLWKDSPFEFVTRGVMANQGTSAFSEPYAQGSYQDEPSEEFAPMIAKHFDRVDSKESKKFIEKAA